MNFDLATNYGRLQLKSPVVVGACPLTADELIRIALVHAGVGAIVLPSFFEEQVVLRSDDRRESDSSVSYQDAMTQRLSIGQDNPPCYNAESYLKLVERASSQLTIPVIASLNGPCRKDWLEFALALENAGATAIELFVRHPMPDVCADPRDVEDSLVGTVTRLQQHCSIPLFLKLGQHYTSLPHLANRLAGSIDGLVLFGTSPAVDIELDRIQLTSNWELTESGSITNSLESIMRVHAHCPELTLVASGGIGNSLDLIKVLLAGADVAMVTSAIYRDGPTAVGTMLEGLNQFLKTRRLPSLNDLKAHRPCLFDCDQDRESYIQAVSSTIDAEQSRGGAHVTECDRWGHPRSPR